MKLKIIIFSLILIMSLSLVYAFESPVYHIGVEIPSDTSENVIIEIIEPNTPNPGGGSPSNRDSTNNFPDSSSPDNNINLETEGDETLDLTFEESEQEDKGLFPRITGAVTGALGTGGAIGALVFVLGIFGTVIFIKFRKIN